MFTKDELNLFKAFLNSDLNIPVKFAEVVISAKAKIESQLEVKEEAPTTE